VAAGIQRSASALAALAPAAAAATSSSAAVAASLAPEDPLGYRALPRALQAKLDSAWNVCQNAFPHSNNVTTSLHELEMPIMQKLELVIKYSSMHDEEAVSQVLNK
jgi:hypothetical protein